jgi:hypothetical protein
MDFHNASYFALLVVERDVRKQCLVGLISKSPKKPSQRALDLGRRGAPGCQDESIAHRIKGPPKNRVG